MKIEQLTDHRVRLTIATKDGVKLARELRRKARRMPSAALEMCSLLSQAGYEAADNFRQPPKIWTPEGPTYPKMES